MAFAVLHSAYVIVIWHVIIELKISIELFLILIPVDISLYHYQKQEIGDSKLDCGKLQDSNLQ